LFAALKAEDIAWPKGCQGDGVVETPKTGVNNPGKYKDSHQFINHILGCLGRCMTNVTFVYLTVKKPFSLNLVTIPTADSLLSCNPGAPSCKSSSHC